MKESEITKRAYVFAKKAHSGQKQVSGKTYFNHPKDVAELLKKWNQDDEVIAAGLLHDIVEDCNIPLKEIQREFGKRVAFLVDGMTFVIKIVDGKPKKDMPVLYKKFSKYSQKEPALVLIKLADILTNIPNIHVESHRDFVINKSYPRLMMFWIPFMEYAGFKKPALKIQKEFNKYTNKKIKSVLFDYLSKKDLLKIKNNLNEIKPKDLK